MLSDLYCRVRDGPHEPLLSTRVGSISVKNICNGVLPRPPNQSLSIKFIGCHPKLGIAEINCCGYI